MRPFRPHRNPIRSVALESPHWSWHAMAALAALLLAASTLAACGPVEAAPDWHFADAGLSADTLSVSIDGALGVPPVANLRGHEQPSTLVIRPSTRTTAPEWMW